MRERAFLLAICVLAALRIFFLNAAYPLFNNVDEQAHVDLVLKYSRGHVPSTGVEPYARESAELFVLYGTPEYFASKKDHPDREVFPPPRRSPEFEKSPQYKQWIDYWTRSLNHEAGSFPTYYALAGAWCATGRALGLSGGQLLYWIRFLNVPLFVLLVWVCWRIGRELLPDRPVLWLGLPLLVAFHPQDIFCSINSDALSPLLFAASLLLLFGPERRERGQLWQGATGLAIAATFLVKPSNIAVAVVLCIAAVSDCRRAARDGKLGKAIPKLATLLAAAGLPVAIWLLRNHLVFGSMTGADEKLRLLTWTAKPFGKMWDHPIFSPHGALYFLTGLTTTFWRGEVVWFQEALAHTDLDRFYFWSSVGLLSMSLPTLWSFGTAKSDGRRVIAVCFVAVATSLLFMAAISIAYDFGRCWAPSRELPYLVAGRLVSCALVPFLIVYLDGLDRLLTPLHSKVVPLVLLAVVIAAITGSELLLLSPVLRSEYNWFHL